MPDAETPDIPAPPDAGDDDGMGDTLITQAEHEDAVHEAVAIALEEAEIALRERRLELAAFRELARAHMTFRELPDAVGEEARQEIQAALARFARRQWPKPRGRA